MSRQIFNVCARVRIINGIGCLRVTIIVDIITEAVNIVLIAEFSLKKILVLGTDDDFFFNSEAFIIS